MMYRNDQRLEPATASRTGDSRRLALKRATEAVHARVESIITSAGMFASLEGYRRYLSATLAIRSHYENLLDASGAATVWPAWPGRRVAHLVAQDLDDLGGARPILEKKAEQPLNPAELLGALYVLEGSSLGARVLSRSAEPACFPGLFMRLGCPLIVAPAISTHRRVMQPSGAISCQSLMAPPCRPATTPPCGSSRTLLTPMFARPADGRD